MRTKKPYDAFLPSAACSKELYDKLEAEAKKLGKSKADLIREALEAFLPDKSRKSRKK